MTDDPDPSDDILHCRACGDVVREHSEEVQRGVWMRRDDEGRPDDRELLCLDCAIDEVRDPDTESRDDVRSNFLSAMFNTPDPRLDRLTEQYDDFDSIDGNEAAERLGITLTDFEKWVEIDPRFELGVSSRFPWVNMESYRKYHRQGGAKSS
jgi:hypothetical protein